MLDNKDITDADKAAVLHGNARRFYNLGAPGL
jgi:predicted TIM-barrel fold metal-dependent hydrolase